MSVTPVNMSLRTSHGYSRNNDSASQEAEIQRQAMKAKLQREAQSRYGWKGGVILGVIIMFLAPMVNEFISTRAFESMEARRARNGERSDWTWSLQTQSNVRGAANGTCWSLQEAHLYYPPNLEKPSQALLGALRKYEKMHRTCVAAVGNWTVHFDKLEAERAHCKYLVYVDSGDSIGDRLASLVGAFVYALLTDRALLVSTDNKMQSLLCNPFEGSSWWTPSQLPIKKLMTAAHQAEYVVENKTNNFGQQDLGRRDIVGLWLQHWYKEPDAMVFCDEFQQKLAPVPWMSFESNQYIVPGLMLLPKFHDSMAALFPNRIILTPMSRYLLHPSNAVWERITRSYAGYLAHADSTVGLEIRTHAAFDEAVGKRIHRCLTGKKILSNSISGTDMELFTKQADHVDKASVRLPHSGKLTSVYVAGEKSHYHDFLKTIFTERPTEDHSLVVFHTEDHQASERHLLTFEQKEAADLWLLSMTDTLLISFHSPLGYLANALGGRKAFFLNIVEHDGFSDANHWKRNGRHGCEPIWSAEGCFHVAPQSLECHNRKAKYETPNPAKWLPYVRHCQDETAGLTIMPGQM